MITFSTFGVVANDFYRLRFTEASLSVREDSNWIIECVVVNIPLALFKTCLQPWSKLDDDCVKETPWWYDIFKKQRSFLVNFSMKCKRIMPFDNMLLCPFKYSTWFKVVLQMEHSTCEGFIFINISVSAQSRPQSPRYPSAAELCPWHAISIKLCFYLLQNGLRLWRLPVCFLLMVLFRKNELNQSS